MWQLFQGCLYNTVINNDLSAVTVSLYVICICIIMCHLYLYHYVSSVSVSLVKYLLLGNNYVCLKKLVVQRPVIMCKKTACEAKKITLTRRHTCICGTYLICMLNYTHAHKHTHIVARHALAHKIRI